MYSLSATECSGALHLLSMPLDVAYEVGQGLMRDLRQVEEVFLTAAQSLLAVVLLIRLRMSWAAAITLFVLFVTQLVLTDPVIRLVYAYGYIGLTVMLIVIGPWRLRLFGNMARYVWQQMRGGTVSFEPSTDNLPVRK